MKSIYYMTSQIRERVLSKPSQCTHSTPELDMSIPKYLIMRRDLRSKRKASLVNSLLSLLSGCYSQTISHISYFAACLAAMLGILIHLQFGAPCVSNSARKLHIRFRITWKHDIAIGYGDGHGAWALKMGTRLLCIIPSGIVRLIAVF